MPLLQHQWKYLSYYNIPICEYVISLKSWMKSSFYRGNILTVYVTHFIITCILRPRPKIITRYLLQCQWRQKEVSK